MLHLSNVQVITSTLSIKMFMSSPLRCYSSFWLTGSKQTNQRTCKNSSGMADCCCLRTIRPHQQSSAAHFSFLSWQDILQGGQNTQRWSALSLLTACLYECTSVWVWNGCVLQHSEVRTLDFAVTSFLPEISVFLPQLWSRPVTSAAQGRHRLTTNIDQTSAC